jgi:hypothetical protein
MQHFAVIAGNTVMQQCCDAYMMHDDGDPVMPIVLLCIMDASQCVGINTGLGLHSRLPPQFSRAHSLLSHPLVHLVIILQWRYMYNTMIFY